MHRCSGLGAGDYPPPEPPSGRRGNPRPKAAAYSSRFTVSANSSPALSSRAPAAKRSPSKQITTPTVTPKREAVRTLPHAARPTADGPRPAQIHPIG